MKINEIIKKILNNEIVIIPSDTVYGISALCNEDNSKKINKIKKRDEKKYLITLFSSIKQLKSYVNVSKELRSVIKISSRTTLIVNGKNNKSLSFRIVKKGDIKKIIKKTGPLYSTSANISGTKYVDDINIFNILVGEDNVFYTKKLGSTPSKIYDFINKKRIR